MAEELKVLSPEVIEDTPFPNQDETTTSESSQSTSGDTVAPNRTKIQPMPVKKVAHELLASSLNTKSRKILAEFEFTESGSLQIGKYENGLSGDLRLTPAGITARDKAGITTFAIDAETGDATFKGTVQSGSLLTGGITIEDENGLAIIDGTGLISSSNFNYGSVKVTNQPVFTPGDNNWHDITGLSQTFTTIRATRVLFLMSVSGLPDSSGLVWVRMNITGVSLTDIPYVTLKSTTETVEMTNHAVFEVGPGEVTYKLQYLVNAPSTSIQIDPTWSTFLALGN